MIIPITLSTPSATNPKLPPCLAKISHDEVVLIELQGSLHVESNYPSERDGKHIGKLKIDEATNKPTLVIGHHLLEGKIQALSKPLAVLVRTGKPRESSASSSNPKMISPSNGDPENDADEDINMLVDEDDDNVLDLQKNEVHGMDDGGKPSRPNVGGEGWAIIAVVKKKIVFSKRPMPITSRATR